MIQKQSLAPEMIECYKFYFENEGIINQALEKGKFSPIIALELHWSEISVKFRPDLANANRRKRSSWASKRFEFWLENREDLREYLGGYSQTITKAVGEKSSLDLPDSVPPGYKVRSIWQQTPDGDPLYSLREDPNGALTKDQVHELIQDLTKNITIRTKRLPKAKRSGDKFLIVMLSDTHVGLMNHGHVENYYSPEVFMDRINIMCDVVDSVIEKDVGIQEVVVVHAGDGIDGNNNKTTRNSDHNLPQNAAGREQVAVLIAGMKMLLESISERITNNSLYFCTNNNHGGVMDWSSSLFLKMWYQSRNPEGNIYPISDFISHFSRGMHKFIITHGYDEELMKRIKMGTLINKATEQILEKYIAKHYLLEPDTMIHTVKGDTHTSAITPASKFHYWSLRPFVGMNGYGQMNFPTGIANEPGFEYAIVDYNNRHIMRGDYIFDRYKTESDFRKSSSPYASKVLKEELTVDELVTLKT